MENVVTWAALVAMATFTITLLKFWSALNDRIQSVGKEADKKIDTLRQEREEAGHNFNTQINTLNAAFSLHREQVAREQREFVTREMLRDFEQRIERSMRESSERTVKAIEQLTDRLDRAFEDRSTPRARL